MKHHMGVACKSCKKPMLVSHTTTDPLDHICYECYPQIQDQMKAASDIKTLYNYRKKRWSHD